MLNDIRHIITRAGACVLVLAAASGLRAQESNNTQSQKSSGLRAEIYGYAMLDAGFDFKQNDPNWFDTMRPTKLPRFEDQFGEDGRTYMGVRQSRFGVKGWIPTDKGEVRTIFEWELFGTGVDAGQTTLRLRHAWGEFGNFGAGQTWSAFMDPDVFPNSLEYWGPNGMVFFRNVQLRWYASRGNNALMFTAERPGGSGDLGTYADRVELQNVRARFPSPDFAVQGHFTRTWGHFQLAGILRPMSWDDVLPDSFDLSGSALGWGVHGSTNVKIHDDVIRFSLVYGEGIENYMNDAPIDVGVRHNLNNRITPVEGEALPVFGLVAFYDRRWNDRFTTSLGYSRVDIDNSDAQAADAFRVGQYALVNLLYYPTANVMAGAEFQWGQRRNFADGFSANDYRIQLGFRYNFSFKLGGDLLSAAGGDK